MPATIFNSPQHRKKFEQKYGTEITAILLDFDARLKKLEAQPENPSMNPDETFCAVCPYSTFVPTLLEFNKLGTNAAPWCKIQPGRPLCTFGSKYDICAEYMMRSMIEEAEGKK